ncbi:hypothetical protein [Arenibacter palladensis]|uniref:hypothetical protein n=1 Tax=Arenibacter palladensis TaxID=237373 RepID=UPI0026E3F68C|nr:hypothetical protein [Arenibacter palladensis]MDO6605290.1 hypothetical protein [Arenibacter palladensis]
MELLAKMKTKSNFKPVYLFTDHDSIETDKNRKTAICKQINASIIECEKVLERTLDKSEIEKVLKDRYNGFKEIVLKQIGFPNATMDSAFGLLGKDPEPVRLAIEKMGGFNPAEMEIKSNRVQLQESFFKTLETSHTHYTAHEGQNKAWAIANDLCGALNRAMQANLIPKMDHPANVQLNNGFDWKTPLKSLITMQDGKVVPNVMEIWRIKE